MKKIKYHNFLLIRIIVSVIVVIMNIVCSLYLYNNYTFEYPIFIIILNIFLFGFIFLSYFDDLLSDWFYDKNEDKKRKYYFKRRILNFILIIIAIIIFVFGVVLLFLSIKAWFMSFIVITIAFNIFICEINEYSEASFYSYSSVLTIYYKKIKEEDASWPEPV